MCCMAQTVVKHYEAMGISHELQQDITQLMHKLVMQTGKFTLSELGYLHMSTLLFNLQDQSLELKLYFDVRLAGRVNRDLVVDGHHIAPVKELNVFNGYFFVGDIVNVVTYEKIIAPKVDISGDRLGRASLVFKKNGGMKELDALVINCSFPLTMAAIANVNLMDPNFAPRVKPIAKAADGAMQMVVTNVVQKVVPVTVDVQYTDGFGPYNPADAVTYLNQLRNVTSKTQANHDRIVESVTKRAKKNKKKSDQSSKWMSKFA